jgi:hypothetical protein
MTNSRTSGVPSGKSVFRSASGIVLSLAWLYMVGWGVLLGISAFQPNAGGWGFEAWILTVADLVPVLLIPIYLVRCVRRKQPPRLRSWLPWVLRLMYVSIMLAVCDSWAAGTHHLGFSVPLWMMSDGGTTGSMGFGYSLTFYKEISGEYGPEVWFWFTPFTVSWTTKHTGVRWLWGR